MHQPKNGLTVNSDSEKTSNCPTADEWNRIIETECSASELAKLNKHLAECAPCREAVQRLNDASRRQFDSLIAEIEGMPIQNAGQSLPGGLVPAGRRMHGGSSVVVKAWDSVNRRFVAVKMSVHWLMDSEVDLHRVMNEAAAIGRLVHPNIVTLYDTYPEFQPPAIVMEWVEGQTLAALIESCEPTLGETVDLIIELTDAVRHAHQHGILHRDIKPSNILMSGERFSGAKLCDFGLAKFSTSTGDWSTATEFVGTPVFMAPEAFRNESGQIGPATDVYSLGAVLYVLLTGKRPFEGTNPIDLGIQVLSRSATPPRQIRPKVPVDLERICMKCLMKEPEDRYPDVASLEADLKRFQKGQSISLRHDSQVKRMRRWMRRDPKSASQVFMFVGFLFAVICALATMLRSSQKSETRAVYHERLSSKNAEEAKQRLSESIRAMSLASPIFKRFLADSHPAPDEVEKIVQFATLRESIGAEPEDLTERLRFYYVTLELADSLRKIQGSLAKATELTKIARSKIGYLLNQNRAKLSEMVIYAKPEFNFVYTVLERAEIQYAHSCAQLYYCLDEDFRNNPNLTAADAAPHMQFLHEAIDHAKSALALNPQLDEAKGDIANYLIPLAEKSTARREFSVAENSFKQAQATSEELLASYPDDRMRWVTHVYHTERLARFYLDDMNDLEKYNKLIVKLEQNYDEMKSGKRNAREFICKLILAVTSSKYRVNLKNGNKDAALAGLNESIQKYYDLEPDKPENEIVQSDLKDLLIERLCLYQLLDINSKTIQAEHERLKTLFGKIDDDNARCETLAKLYLFAPMPGDRDFQKAQELIESSKSQQKSTQFIRELCLIANNPNATQCLDENVHRHLVENLTTQKNDQFKCLFETEQLIRSSELDSAVRHLQFLQRWCEEEKSANPILEVRMEQLAETLRTKLQPQMP